MQTAYLKAHYPTEFYAGLLTSVMDDTEQLALYLGDCKKNHVAVLPPDINTSRSEFSVADEGILYYGLNSIKRVGKDLIDGVLAERDESGEFKSLYDFISRCPKANKGAIENLIKAGAFDFTEYNRPSLINNIETCQKAVKNKAKKVCENQISIFDFMGMEDAVAFEEPEVQKEKDWSPVEKALKEKEATGIFVTLHPLEAVKCPKNTISISKLITGAQDFVQTETKAAVCGIITEKKIFFTKKTGDKMAVMKIEDANNSVKVVLFPKKYAEIGEQFNENDIISVMGRVNVDEEFDEVSIYAENMSNLNIEKTLFIFNPHIHTREEAEAVKFTYVNFFGYLYKSKVDGYDVKIVFKNDKGRKGVLDLGIKISDIDKAEKAAKKQYGEQNVIIQEKKRF